MFNFDVHYSSSKHFQLVTLEILWIIIIIINNITILV